jgi:hypothetical protein
MNGSAVRNDLALVSSHINLRVCNPHFNFFMVLSADHFFIIVTIEGNITLEGDGTTVIIIILISLNA